jgi:tetratricopeptide (TPR) repeat protein
MVLYNRVTGKIVHDRLISNQSSLHNYSRKPSIQKERFAKMVEKTVIEEALFHVCPSKAPVKRKIYYANKKDAATKEIDEGVDLAREDRWPLAASKWSNVLIKDPKNGVAHHNLGVQLERQGDFFKAMEHFKAAMLAPPMGDKIYDSIQNQYRPKLDGVILYPQISFVTGGSWAYVRSDAKALPELKRASLYRLEPVVNAESSRVNGVSLREVGLIRTWSGTGAYYPGRIREFLLEYPVKTGDLILVN